MILVRSPLRVTFGGGGTDLPSYYREHGGFVVSAAIQKYVYVAVVNPFSPGIYLKTNKIENVAHVSHLEHTIIKECLKAVGIVDRVAITTFADVPAGTGLGSSGALVTALLKALHIYTRKPITTEELARLACEIEIDRCGLVGGKQDQYTAAYGGVNGLTFEKDDTVIVAPLKLSTETLLYLEENLMLFYTGSAHNSSEMQATPSDIEALHETKVLGLRSYANLIGGDVAQFACGLSDQWHAKKGRCPHAYTDHIIRMRDLIMSNGALGCKLIGSGGGGFLMAYGASVEHALHDLAMRDMATSMIRVRFDFEGTRVVT